MQGNLVARTLLYVFLLLPCAGNLCAEWEDRFGPPVEVPFSAILENPETWIDVPVRFQVRFSRLSTVYTPFFTKFSSDQYINFRAWDIQTPIWTKEGFENEYPYFYVSKYHPEYKAFLRYQKFETLTVYAVPMGLFGGRPYFHISWACRLPGHLDIYNLKMLNRGMGAYQKRDFANATAIFDQISKTNPPADIAVMLYRNTAKIHMYEQRDYTGALVQLAKAEEINPNDSETQTLKYLCDQYLVQKNLPELSPRDLEPDRSASAKLEAMRKQQSEQVTTIKTPAAIDPQSSGKTNQNEEEDVVEEETTSVNEINMNEEEKNKSLPRE